MHTVNDKNVGLSGLISWNIEEMYVVLGESHHRFVNIEGWCLDIVPCNRGTAGLFTGT